MSCIIGAFHASYLSVPLVWERYMGIREGGSLALLGCGGAMGIGALDYALHGPNRTRLVVAVDVSDERLARLRTLFPPEEAEQRGCRLVFVDCAEADAVPTLRGISTGQAYDGFVFAAVKALAETGDAVLAQDGCLNFFARPADKSFSAALNLGTCTTTPTVQGSAIMDAVTLKVLLLGRTRIDEVAARAVVAPLPVELYTGTSLGDVVDVMSREPIDVVIMGGGLPIDDRVAIVRHVYAVSETTSVHCKDRASGPRGFLPFVRAVLRGLAENTSRSRD